jgi:DNA-binding GntR family transcriptional regulator
MVLQAYRRLLQMIEERKIRPADVVSHRQLAKLLEMSKTPVGLALQRLEQDGLVHSVARSRTQVRRIDADTMWDMINWRIALECQIARLACTLITPPAAKRLWRLACQVDKLYIKSPQASFSSDMKFHLDLGTICGCDKLRSELEKLNIYYLKLAVHETVPMQERPPLSSTPDHRTLVKAIMAGDPEKAERRMREHLENSALTARFMAWYRQTRLPASQQQNGNRRN